MFRVLPNQVIQRPSSSGQEINQKVVQFNDRRRAEIEIIRCKTIKKLANSRNEIS